MDRRRLPEQRLELGRVGLGDRRPDRACRVAASASEAPANAVGTVICWSSANPIRSASGSCAMSGSATGMRGEVQARGHGHGSIVHVTDASVAAPESRSGRRVTETAAVARFVFTSAAPQGQRSSSNERSRPRSYVIRGGKTTPRFRAWWPGGPTRRAWSSSRLGAASPLEDRTGCRPTRSTLEVSGSRCSADEVFRAMGDGGPVDPSAPPSPGGSSRRPRGSRNSVPKLESGIHARRRRTRWAGLPPPMIRDLASGSTRALRSGHLDEPGLLALRAPTPHCSSPAIRFVVRRVSWLHASDTSLEVAIACGRTRRRA
jgi:hypothetical protein